MLDVAETGTEAAAATGMAGVGCCAVFDFLEIFFNRPFLMIISDTKAHIALFMAKVTNPERSMNFPNGEGASSQRLESKRLCFGDPLCLIGQ